MKPFVHRLCVAQTAQVACRCYTDARTVRAPHAHEGFVSADNEEYMERLQKMWAEKRAAVDPSWASVLENLPVAPPDRALVTDFKRPETIVQSSVPEGVPLKLLHDELKVAWMIRNFETNGHFLCDLDPLGLYRASLDATIPIELDPTFYGFSAADLDKTFNIKSGTHFGGTVVAGNTPMKLRDIIRILRERFCGAIGFEFMQTGMYNVRDWWRQQILKTADSAPSPQDRLEILDKIISAQCLEELFEKKYGTVKRFGLDGCESLISALQFLIDDSAALGVDDFVLAMPHRGRLNVLVNIVGKPLRLVLDEFEGKQERGPRSGDVKYHLGYSKKQTLKGGHEATVSLLYNPSHLEAVDPVAMGRTRAKQARSIEGASHALSIVMHGDAAFAGQGVCYESMAMCALDDYSVGGTIHIVVNNQVGFTTNPRQSRSSAYCTDLAKVHDAPVLHVCADDPEQLVRAARMAAAFRATYHHDIVLDVICYRRFGHNETDQPAFTQPVMYKRINKLPTIMARYGEKLIQDGLLTPETLQGRIEAARETLKKEHAAESKATSAPTRPHEICQNMRDSSHVINLKSSSSTIETLRYVSERLTALPPGFVLHKGVDERVFKPRAAGLHKNAIDWAMAEQLAFGSLLREGVNIRISGQDVERGTFSHRHCKVHDANTGTAHVPLRNLYSGQPRFDVCNSPLSEYGVLGFEVGYAMEASSNTLVMWEAQFGDFANGGQIIFDQFLSSSETKWGEASGIVVSLPHGFDGQGPEHSSARIERYLELSDDTDTIPANFRSAPWPELSESRIRAHNWQVCYASIPSNYFHLLRRQFTRNYRKPLISIVSKQNLRGITSPVSEFLAPTRFQEVVERVAVSRPRRLVLCSGQVVQKLLAFLAGRPKESENVAVASIEQIAPFPWEPVADLIEKYHAEAPIGLEVVWVQEEPRNMGPYPFVRRRLEQLVEQCQSSAQSKLPLTLHYVGRDTAASPATGYSAAHKAEEADVLLRAFIPLRGK